ncbi:peroxidase [Tribolium castaneum]|uniref:Peroxidase-like Protein n=1 Tax=Tribolium castaneum TaxID=7070 RepID=D6W6G2_TRICA|nr:PREDICTED: peroxidase [Tribolium castaneum]EFA11571.1 Peroxidase-like Protein [Tribolium castaneum]|eukprot:XP_969523.1 PREDICTED: peroxidase [Tribolium castaneum]
MKFTISCIFLCVCAQTLAFEAPIHPLYTVDATKTFGDSSEYDTCDLTPPECDPQYKYRSFDGSCNNLKHPVWGMVKSAFARVFPPRYSDGKELPPVASDGGELPNARHIVTSVFDDKDVPDTVSLIVAQWAQFIAHDFAVGVPKTGVDDCCASDDPLVCLSIPIPEDDAFYSQYNKTCLSMTRTQTTLTGDCDPQGPKQQINGVSHGLDGSQIYGSDPETASSLREHKGGRMLVRQKADGRCFLPSKGSCYNSDVCYVAGESRVNQNTQLTIMHTMLVREHNRIADILASLHPEWDDETVYQETRSIVVAEYLHITYNHFLPNILNENFMIRNELRSRNQGYHKYDEEIPNIVLISFSNPAFRIFHSGLQGVIGLYNYHLDPTSHINLTDYMNSPGILEEENHFDELILGVITQPMQTIDTFYTSQIDGKLFHFGKPYGADLNALDIQRARDHAVPGYPTVLYGCRGIEVRDFDDLAAIWPEKHIKTVRNIYKSVDDIDLFVGVNFENKPEGHRMSPVLECLIGEQFYRWKNGDRFWYEVENQPHSFTPAQLDEIRQATLSRLVCDTSDYIVNITVNAWKPPGDNNPIVPCENVPSIDLSKWL